MLKVMTQRESLSKRTESSEALQKETDFMKQYVEIPS